MANYDYEKLRSLYNQGVRTLSLSSYGEDDEEMCIEHDNEIILFFNKEDDEESERLQNEASDLTISLSDALDKLSSLKAEVRDCFNFFQEEGIISEKGLLLLMQAYKIMPTCF